MTTTQNFELTQKQKLDNLTESTYSAVLTPEEQKQGDKAFLGLVATMIAIYGVAVMWGKLMA